MAKVDKYRFESWYPDKKKKRVSTICIDSLFLFLKPIILP